MDQAQLGAITNAITPVIIKTITDAFPRIIRTIREEIWSTNQMQLAAFLENNPRVTPCNYSTEKQDKADPASTFNFCVVILIVVLPPVAFYYFLLRAVWRRAKANYKGIAWKKHLKEQEEKQRLNKQHLKEN